MEVVTLDDLDLRNMTDTATVAFFSTLFEMAGFFSTDGERILRTYNGYRNRKWVEALFEKTANCGYFRRSMITYGKSLPYSAIEPLITNELIADFCLADDLLKSLYYEYQIYHYQQCFTATPKIPHTVRHCLKELCAARLAFRRQKLSYLRIAYCSRVPRKIHKLYDASRCTQEFIGEIDLDAVFSIMPIIFELYPRDTASDAAPLSKLCRKYARLIAFCDEAAASLSD